MYKYILILFLHLIDESLFLVIYDVTTENIYSYGVVTIKAYLEIADMFYRRYGYTESCDFNFLYLNNDRFCDISIYNQLSLLKPVLRGNRTVQQFTGYEKLSFMIASDRSCTINKEITKELNTGNIDLFSNWDHNYIYFYPPNLPLLTTISFEITDIIQFTTTMGDFYSWIYGYYVMYGIFTRHAIAIRTKVDESTTIRKETYAWGTKTLMLEQYILTAKCEMPNFGKTCWFKCIDNERLQCNCHGDPNNNAPCLLKCKSGWLTKYIIYVVENIEIIMTRCDTIDICVLPPPAQCINSQVCLPVDNTTYFCEHIYASIMKGKNGKNITSDVFLYSEIMKIQLETSVLVHSDVGVNTTTHIDINEYVFKNDILNVLDGYEMVVIFVNGLNFIDQVLNFTITFNLQAWIRLITRNKNFRVNVAPDYIRIYHRENWTSADFYIYIGEHLVTNTSGLPEYRSIFFWQSEILNISFNFGDDILVPGESSFGLADLKCNSTLIMPERNDASIAQTFTYFVMPFQFFNWNKTNNVLEYGTTVKCQAKAYIIFELYVSQLRGITRVNIINDYVWLSGITGGYYELICHFITKYGYFFTTYIKFKLRNNATEICLFLFTNTIGSIVQCGHNGNIPDEYTIYVKLYLFNGDSMDITYDKLNFLRIPYTVKNPQYQLVCNITNTINMMKINLKTVGVLSYMAHDVYYVTKQNRICLQYSDYVDEPEILTNLKESITLFHFLFYLEVHQELLNSTILLFILLAILPVITGISVLAFAFTGFNQNKLVIENITRINKFLKKRNMEDKLKFQSRISKHADMKKMEFYFTNSV